MSQLMKIDRVEMLDKTGQRRVYPEQKNTLYISCLGVNEITIEEVVPVESDKKEWCVQVIAHSNHCILTNFYPKDEPIHFQLGDLAEAGRSKFGYLQTKQVSYGEKVTLNELTFIFHRKRGAKSIEVDFSLDAPELTAAHSKYEPLEGTIILRNKGNKTSAQFHIEVSIEGIKTDAYRVDSPDPKLINLRQQKIKFRLGHLLPQRLLPGSYLIEVIAKADEYPDEVAADFQEVYVQAFYDFDLHFENDSPCL